MKRNSYVTYRIKNNVYKLKSTRESEAVKIKWNRQLVGVNKFLTHLHQKNKLVQQYNNNTSMQIYTGWETTLDPPPQPQLQQPQKIYTDNIKIWSMSDSVAKFQEPESLFDAWKLSFFCTRLNSKIRQKMSIFLQKIAKHQSF